VTAERKMIEERVTMIRVNLNEITKFNDSASGHGNGAVMPVRAQLCRGGYYDIVMEARQWRRDIGMMTIWCD
jgi:hypothetical protein